MISFQKKNVDLIRRYSIVGGRRLSNYWWSATIFFGGGGFLLTGISSFFNRNLLLILPTKIKAYQVFEPTLGYTTSDRLEIVNGIPSLPFFPQGIVLSFYGFLGLWFSFHLWFALLWKIGAGFNEFNGKEKYVRIFRWGRPGKNRRIDFKYNNEFIETIKIELIPKPTLSLCIKGGKIIPLTRASDFIPLEDLETQAAELTTLLQIPLDTANHN